MSKHILAFLLPILLVLLAGCRSEGTAQPTPTHYWTALEAYEQIRPAMLTWHEDAVVVLVGATYDERPEWRVHPDGTSRRWGFTIGSPNALRETKISFVDGEIRVGKPDVIGGEVRVYRVEEGLPIDTMIDSHEAVEIALRNGVSANDSLVDIRTERFDSASDVIIPPSWRLTYGHPHDWSHQRVMIIDAVTGEVLRNDFAEP